MASTLSPVHGKVVLVLGASGIVGGGAALGLVQLGANVIAPFRSGESKEAFSKEFGHYPSSQQWDAPVVDYSTEQGLQDLAEYIRSERGGVVDHIFACMGGSVAKGPLSVLPAPELESALSHRVFSQVLAAKYLLPLVRPTPDSCYLVTTGRLGESCPAPEWAIYTLVNAAVYGVVTALRSEIKTHRLQELRIGAVIRRDSEPFHHQWPDLRSHPASSLVPSILRILSGEVRDDIVRWTAEEH
ncbi:hypothetical protein ACKKBG_A32605 [Auxenochlorella protothecoides x Auxenochlorella symbiontica]